MRGKTKEVERLLKSIERTNAKSKNYVRRNVKKEERLHKRKREQPK